jgi:hypothetical protein
MARRKATSIHLHIERKGLSPETLTWQEMKVLVDAFAKAVQAMPGGEGAGIMPVAVGEGCAKVTVRISPTAVKAANAVQRGPTRRWKPEMYEGVRDFWRYTRECGCKVRLGQRGRGRLVVVPGPDETFLVSQREVVVGKVFRVGGKKHEVEIQTATEHVVTASTGRKLVVELGALLHQSISAECETTRRVPGGDLAWVRLVSFRVLEQGKVSPEDLLRRYQDAVGEVTIDVDALMREHRAT